MWHKQPCLNWTNCMIACAHPFSVYVYYLEPGFANVYNVCMYHYNHIYIHCIWLYSYCCSELLSRYHCCCIGTAPYRWDALVHKSVFRSLESQFCPELTSEGALIDWSRIAAHHKNVSCEVCYSPIEYSMYFTHWYRQNPLFFHALKTMSAKLNLLVNLSPLPSDIGLSYI